MNRLASWLDNPILVKHARSRLRPAQALPAVAVVMVLALGVVLMGYQYNGLMGGETFGGLMTLQAVILGVMGASQVASSAGKARDSGILDFHRVTPMPPASMAMGFLAGAPIREYAMFAATLPFSMACVWMGRPSVPGAVQLMASLVLASWALHAIALLNALAGKGGRSGNRGVVGLVMFLLFGGVWLVPNFSIVATGVDSSPTGRFFGAPLPWLAIVALDLAPPIGFLLVGSTRKLASERAHVLTKPQAVACLATGAVLLLGNVWTLDADFPWVMFVLYALVAGAVVLAGAVTPGRDEFIKGIRKAAKEGKTSPSAWSDRGLNRPAVFALGAVVLAASTAAWRSIDRPVSWMTPNAPISYSLPIAIGVLVVAYFGLAAQFFGLRFGKRGPVFLALFLFSAWLLPLASGAISAAAVAQRRTPDSPPDRWSPAIASLSPIFGVVSSSGIVNVPDLVESRAAALLPALCFALLFNNLLSSARRRIGREIQPEPVGKAEEKSTEQSNLLYL